MLLEFWRNREAVLRDPRDAKKTIKELDDYRDRALNAFRAWANRVSLEGEHVADLIANLENDFSAIQTEIDERDMANAARFARDTGTDSVLKVLEPVLAGRCGPPLNSASQERAVAEGLRRVEERLPPGYMDKKKGDKGAAGDYLVWEQVLLEAARRREDVLFVTGDVKEDWWREEGGERRGPRLELVQELQRRAGVRLFMLRPTSLLEHAQTYLGVHVKPGSVQDVERVEQFLAAGESSWTPESAALLLSRLDLQAPVQSAAIRLAVRQGGRVEREQVYGLGRYADERSLRGFTRPVSRLVQEMQADGLLGSGAGDVLVTKYDHGAVTASAFEVSAEFARFVDPVFDERKVLRFLLRLGTSQSPGIEEIANGTAMAMPLLGRVLATLLEKGLINGPTAWQVDYPLRVTNVTREGRRYAGGAQEPPSSESAPTAGPAEGTEDEEFE